MTATAHRRIIAIFTAAMLMTTLGYTTAFATGPDEIEEGFYYTFAFELPMTSSEWNDAGKPHGDQIWPQAYVAHMKTGDSPDLHALDSQLPDCGVFQVDVYWVDDEADRTKVASFVGGTLHEGDDDSVEKGWKFVDKGDCPPPTTTTTEPATTTTEAEVLGTTVTTVTTATTVTVVTTVPDVTTTTAVAGEVLGTTITAVGEVAADTLPFTGFEAGGTAKLGLLAMLAGGLMLFAVRGRKEDRGTVADIGGWSNL